MITSPVSTARSGPAERAEELATITGLLAGRTDPGRGLVLEGEVGSGKSALAQAVAEEARRRGHRVLRCAGLPNTSPIGYAALHELLQPILSFAGTLPAQHRSAVLNAFGLEEGPATDPRLVALGARALLEQAAADTPLLVVVEDADRVDRSSAQALSLIGQRAPAGTLLLATSRPRLDGQTLPWPRMTLHALPEDEAGALLERLAADLPVDLRARIVREAAGNPLALHEFADAARRQSSDRLLLQPRLPMTERLKQALAGQLQDLPPRSRQLLLVLATAGTTTLVDVIAAAARLDLGLADLLPLEAARLVRVSDQRLVLTRAALGPVLLETAPISERLRVHAALAEVTSDPFRAAWHRSNATLQRDEKLAAELETLAGQALDRSAGPEAKTLLHRAAVHSPAAEDRARRLARAGEAARSAGLIEEVEPLLNEAQSLTSEAATLADIAVTRTTIGLTAGAVRDTGEDLLALSGRFADRLDPERRMRLLWLAAVNARGRGLPPQEWRRIQEHLHAFETDSPLKPVALALLAPLGEQAGLRAQLPGLVPRLFTFPLGMLSLAIAAESLQDLETATTCWGLSHELLRAHGSAVEQSQALRGRANVLRLRGRIGEALQDAQRALEIAEDTGNAAITSMATASLALSHALLGNGPAAQAAIARSEQLMGLRPVVLTSADVRWAKGLQALHAGRHRDALVEFMHVSVHPSRALWVVADATEAAVRAQRADLVHSNVEQAEAVARAYDSSHLKMLAHRSRALLEADAGASERAGEHFAAAVKNGLLAESPLELARTRLLYAEWLRRQRRVLPARQELTAAHATFAELGAEPFLVRAAAELRATGDTPSELSEGLTPQELRVARLAAEGMSNKEIAQHTLLSHRTVSTHLYKAFPKLGIAKRAQLREALGQAGLS